MTEAITLSRPQAATTLGISPATLDRLDAAGTGPKAVRIGRRRLYRPADLELWLEQRLDDSPAA